MNPFTERKTILKALTQIGLKDRVQKEENQDDVIITCRACGSHLTKGQLRDNDYICFHCGCHYRMSAQSRIDSIADPGSFKELYRSLSGTDPLNFPEYSEKIKAERKKTGLREAVVTGSCTIDGQKVVIGVMDARFMMASMGMAVGEKITRAIEHATKRKRPIILFCASGGARMQEGIISLMQMAKTSAAIAKHDEAGLLYISVLTNPTTGGVTASFASLGDIVLAEPEALIGFAGPRVIEQTIGEKLPEGFQRSEFQREHGFVDAVVPRKDMKKTLSRLLRLHRKEAAEWQNR